MSCRVYLRYTPAMRVVVLEDDAQVGRALRRKIMAVLGWDVEVVETGEAFVLATAPPTTPANAMVLDVNLGRGARDDGVTALRLARAAGVFTKCAFYSGQEEESVVALLVRERLDERPPCFVKGRDEDALLRWLAQS